MASDRGATNLERFNNARSAAVVPSLTHELQLCKKRKLQFKTVGLLAAHLSDRLKVHRTTLLRNLKYKVLLMEQMGLHKGAVTLVPDTTFDPVILQAKLATARLEASNLRQEIKHLKAQLARQEHTPSAPGISKPYADFANLAMLVVNVLASVGDTIMVDYENRALVDLAAKPSERVIASVERAGTFISWLEQNQAVPAVRALRKQKGEST